MTTKTYFCCLHCLLSPTESELEDAALEAAHFAKVVNAFAQYRRWSLAANQRRRKDFYSIPRSDQALLPGYIAKLDEIDDRIRRNADFLDAIVDHACDLGFDSTSDTAKVEPSRSDAEKVRSTLKQIVRDWSIQGAGEREACYTPILGAVDEAFGTQANADRSSIRVLVPGGGLGRLAWEFARRGYCSAGNEFSLHMLLASNFMLNHQNEAEEHALFPYISSLSNISTEALLKEIRVPDVIPSSLPSSADFSFIAGDFIEVFSTADHAGFWHVVATCFFIDCAQNIVQFLRIIHTVLRPGGLWINLGPTLWHYEDSSGGEPSIELSADEIKELATRVGFVIEREETRTTTYAGNSNGTLQNVYICDFWVARKI